MTTVPVSREGAPEPLSFEDLGPLGPVLDDTPDIQVVDLPDLEFPDAPAPLCVHRLRRPVPAEVMGSLPARRFAMEPEHRSVLDEFIQWPLRIVVDDSGQVAGMVTRHVPEPFRTELSLPSGARRTVDLEAQHLFVAPATAAKSGIDLSPVERVEICARLAEVLAFLHGPDIDVVVGGLTGRNVVVRLGPTPEVHLRVATSVHPTSGIPAVDRLGAEWRRPDVARRSDRQRDCYSLALFIARALAPGPFSSVSVSPDAAAEPLGSAGAELLARALSAREATPSALAWLRVLAVRCGRAIEPPRVISVEPTRSLVAVGEPVDVRWTATQATSIEVAAPGAEPVRIAVRDGEGVVAAYPARTGRIAVSAHNEHGAHELLSGPVAVFDIASAVRVAMPEPVLPPPVPLPESRTAPGFPDIAAVPFPVIATPEPTIDLPPLPTIVAATATYPGGLPSTTAGSEPQ